MEWNIGVEMRNEYRRMELARAAMKLGKDIMLCKPGENLVITYDTCVDERVVHALTEAAYTIESVPTVIYYPTGGRLLCRPAKASGRRDCCRGRVDRFDLRFDHAWTCISQSSG